MNYPSLVIPTLEALYQLGMNICTEIEKFQPDLVIGLAHSGWMPVVVAKTLWAEMDTGDFPPTVRTNIGLEKHEVYTAQFGKSYPAFCCITCSDDPGRIGHYMAWVAEQDSWMETLRAQIEAVYPVVPTRILVVDDLISGWCSGLAVLSLLDNLYPQVETYVLAGRNDLTDAFVSAWLEEFIPTLLTDEDRQPDRFTRYRSPWQKLLKPLINGTEDIAPDRLDWQPLNSESPAVSALVEYLPVETVLAAPAWARSLACSYAVQRLYGKIANSIPDISKADRYLSPIRHLSLSAENRLAARAWQRNGVTYQDIVEIFGETLNDRKKGLRAVAVDYEWQRNERRKKTRYFPLVALESWITAYDLYRATDSDAGKPVYCFAEFWSGQIWAGAYPIASDSSVTDQPFKDLLSAGVDAFISLIGPEDTHNRWPYRNKLSKVSRECGKKVSIYVLPLPFRASPTRVEMEKVLKKFTRVLKAGQQIYLHAGHNLEGRTPMVLACWLIQQGFSPEQALARVNDFWLHTLPYLVCSPLSDEQLQFIQDWAKR